MRCAQCGTGIGERWYRTHLKTGESFHVLCLMSRWEIGDAKDRKTTEERMRALRAYSAVQMPTGRLPATSEGL